MPERLLGLACQLPTPAKSGGEQFANALLGEPINNYHIDMWRSTHFYVIRATLH